MAPLNRHEAGGTTRLSNVVFDPTELPPAKRSREGNSHATGCSTSCMQVERPVMPSSPSEDEVLTQVSLLDDVWV